MATLTELTAEIVSAHASGSSITSEELIKNIHSVYNTLKFLESGDTTIPTVESALTEVPAAPAITIKQAFKNKDEVLCMICGKAFKTLKRHLTKAHNLKPAEYRKQFGIPSTQTLAAKSYVDSRKKMAIDMGLGAGLVKFRADKKAEAAAKNVGIPVSKAKTPPPAIKAKAVLPAVKTKAALPAKIEVAKKSAKVKTAAGKSTAKAKK